MTDVIGSIWYSMNVCEIIQHTQCDVSLSNGGVAPPTETSGGSGVYNPPPSGKPEPSATAPTKPGESSAPSGGEYYPPPGASTQPSASNGQQPPPSGSGSGKPAPSASQNGEKPSEKPTGTTAETQSASHGSKYNKPSGTETVSGTEAASTSSTAGALALLPAVPSLIYGAAALFLGIVI